MSQVDWREVAAAVLPGIALAVAGGGTWAILAATLDTAERAALAELVAPRAALLALVGLLLAAALGSLLRNAYLRWVRSAARLAEEAKALLAADVQRTLAADGGPEL
ncbi:MAG: DNA polymerase III subunit epsilon, partial [Aquincola sp.]|nr:DNA polymerase III subunit epsilon [Aquincola sp.]